MKNSFFVHPVAGTGSFWSRLFPALSGACCMVLGFPGIFPSLPPLVLIWPLALCKIGAESSSGRDAFTWGLMTSFAGAIAALYWLAMPVAQVGGLPWPGAAACAALIALILATQGGFFAIAARTLRHYGSIPFAVMMSLVWYFLELLYALTAGFPWLPLSGALAQWPLLIQPAALCGAYLTGSLWLCALLLCTGRKFFTGLSLAAALLLFSWWQLHANPEEVWPSGPDTLPALMVEGNVDQNQKWTLPFQERSLLDYLRLSEDGLKAAEKQLDGEKPLIIWPETALPFFYEANPELAAMAREGVRHLGCPLLFGAPGMEKEPGGKERIFNRAFLLNPEGKSLGHYDKVHLVPFGEYLPSWLKLEFLEALLQGVGIYDEGSSSEPLRYGRVALGLLICYEGIFPWLAQDRVASGANILVDISNDGWFGLSPAARQHLYLTVLRAVEQGRYMFRATNTGISAVIDAQGRVVSHGPQFKAGSMLCCGRLLEGKSVYHRLAAWLPYVCGFALVFVWVTGRRKHVSVE